MKHTVIGLVMLLAAGLSIAMTPTHKIADDKPRIDLDGMVPKQFGVWSVDPAAIQPIRAPGTGTVGNRVYNQVLMRTYKNPKGERIMLTIAYGGDQSDNLQVHLPEVCYVFQGFSISRQQDGKLTVADRVIPVKRLVAVSGRRNEPITYWITVGDRIATGNLTRKLAQLRYGLTGEIPDGILIRISNITRDVSSAYRLHGVFMNDLITSLRKEDTGRLLGLPDP